MTSDRELLAQALDALDRVQAQLERERAAVREPIAIVGLGCRFPGAEGPDAFWEFCERGGDAVREMPSTRDARFAAGDTALARGGFFDDVAGFDAAFFGIADDEARAMDPHLRFLLEAAWHALEDAGESGGTLAGTQAGVWLALGAQGSDYAGWLLDDANRHAIEGGFHSLMAGRLSYLLDLRGPSLVVDAACASGLAAVHLACESLRRRECDTALAAAVNLVLSPRVSAAVRDHGLWSKRGACRPFDAAADGFVRGEGCAVVVLKRLSDALARGDAIRAVVHGSAVGQDGRSNGLTAPSGPAQEAVLRRALQQAGIAAASVGYVEAHATGTLVGDAIEAEALASVYGSGRAQPLRVGALKASLGHLEAASGMAALVRALLAIERRTLPPTPHHDAPSPHIAGLPIDVVARRAAWPADAPHCGVSAFGMSGTNAHVILGPAPAESAPRPARVPRTFQHRAYWIGGKQDGHDLLRTLAWIEAPSAAAPHAPRRALRIAGTLEGVHRVRSALARAFDVEAPAASEWLFVCGVEADAGDARRGMIAALLALVREIALKEGTVRRLTVAGIGAAGACGPAIAVSLARSARLEHPDIDIRALEIDADVADPGAVLAAEIAAAHREPWIRLTAGGRRAPRVMPLAAGHRPFAPRADACYIVAGAFGGIGREIARWLVERGARDVMLLGRTAREFAEIPAWRERGVTVRAVACDVADAAAVHDAFAPLVRDSIAIAGVFHAAGVQDDELLFRQDAARFDAVLRGKVDGACVLREATRGQPLEAFVLFSSVATVPGLAGAGAYVAANAALVALAQRWRREGVPALAVRWGTWEGSGMARAGAATLASHWEALGILPFAPADAIAALESLLACDAVDAIAARADWTRLALPDGRAAATRTLSRGDDLGAVVRSAVAHVLGLRDDDPALDRPFGELGLASLAAMELRAQLAARLDIPVPATLAFNHPSVEAVTKFLSKRLAREAAPT